MGHRWRGYEHRELHTMINAGPGVRASDPQTSYWQGLATELTEVDEELNAKLTNLGSRWEGKAAESAQSGLTPLASWAGDAETGATVMKSSSELQGGYISDARARMPEPVEVTTPAPSGWDIAAATGAGLLGMPGPALDVLAQAQDHEEQEAAKNEAEERAVETMRTYESSSTWNRETLGTFVAPPDVVVSTPQPQSHAPVGGISQTSVSNVRSGDPSGSDDDTGPRPPTTGPNAPVAPPTVVGDPPPESPGGGGGGGGGGGTVLPPTTTNPSDVFVPPPGGGNGLPLPTNPGPLPPTQTPNPLLPGGGPLPFGAGDNAGDVARRALPLRPGGMPVTGGPLGRGGLPGGPGGLGAVDGERMPSQLGRGGAIGEGGVVRSGPGAAGAAGRGGVRGPVGAAGRRQEGEEDEEHLAPDYLLETDDVFGDDRRVSPTVIGE